VWLQVLGQVEHAELRQEISISAALRASASGNSDCTPSMVSVSSCSTMVVGALSRSARGRRLDDAAVNMPSGTGGRITPS